jgi:hypothetical protein
MPPQKRFTGTPLSETKIGCITTTFSWVLKYYVEYTKYIILVVKITSYRCALKSGEIDANRFKNVYHYNTCYYHCTGESTNKNTIYVYHWNQYSILTAAAVSLEIFEKIIKKMDHCIYYLYRRPQHFWLSGWDLSGGGAALSNIFI